MDEVKIYVYAIDHDGESRSWTFDHLAYSRTAGDSCGGLAGCILLSDGCSVDGDSIVLDGGARLDATSAWLLANKCDTRGLGAIRGLMAIMANPRCRPNGNGDR